MKDFTLIWASLYIIYLFYEIHKLKKIIKELEEENKNLKSKIYYDISDI